MGSNGWIFGHDELRCWTWIEKKKVENSVILYVVYFLFDKNIVVECFVLNKN